MSLPTAGAMDAMPATGGRPVEPRPVPGRAGEGAGAALETRINRALAAAIGLLLPVLTLRTAYIGTPVDLLSRIVPVDLVCAALLGALFLRHRMKAPPPAALLYLAAMVLALIPGLAVTPGPESQVWVQFLALLMAFGFYLAGLNLAASPGLLRWLLAGMAVSAIAEAVVVFHDALAPLQWFPDPMEGRVRGTFRANGQLGAYGFCAGGLLATFGATLAGPGWRRVCVGAAILCASFIFLASRRTGMISVLVWGALFAVLGARFAGRRFYPVFVASFLVLLLLGAAFWPHVDRTFMGRRFMAAVTSLQDREGFIQTQLRRCYETAEDWFPFGYGPGRGYRINPREAQEVHNGLLAVLVELGVLGLLGFLGMIGRAFPRGARPRGGPDGGLRNVLLVTFLVVCFLFMAHNTLYRDRTFMLYLGLATTAARQEVAA